MIALAILLAGPTVRDSAAIAAALRTAIAADANALMHRPAIPDVREPLTATYQRRGWQPLWIVGQQPTPGARRLLAELSQARDRGLDPDQYDAARLSIAADSLPSRGTGDAAAFDVALAAAAARYALALDRGRVAPDLLHPMLELPREPFDLARFLDRLVRAPDPAALLHGLEPAYLHYRLLTTALIRYRRAQAASAASSVSWPASLHPGDSSAAVPELRRFLNLTGDLGDRDASRASAADSIRFDHALAMAVRRFQGRLKLRTDTVVEPSIRKLLLVAIDQRARQMELALERWRWLPRTLAPTTLFVNIPAFRLYTLDGNGERKTDSLAMDVVVGRALDNDTPLLATHITAIQTHPAWVVPRAIALKEIRMPALRDTTYLARHHYQLMHADSELPPTRANVRRIGDAVHVRQTPGPWNALGRLKFVTPNGADIYLHDTPEQRFFRQSRRDFSHGCIRVSDPVALARFVLRDDTAWTARRLADALADPVARLIPLRRPVALLILYQTVSARESGEVVFYPDIYGNDSLLDRALNAGYPYPAPRRPAPAAQKHSP
jgi:murein L,D-transpeptidase YcbB/YkuD